MSEQGREYRCTKCEPECPYWSDGRHAYEVHGIPVVQNIPSTIAKRCECGAEIHPRVKNQGR